MSELSDRLLKRQGPPSSIPQLTAGPGVDYQDPTQATLQRPPTQIEKMAGVDVQQRLAVPQSELARRMAQRGSAAPPEHTYASPIPGQSSLGVMGHFLAYPATETMMQLGSRVDAAQAGAIRGLTGQATPVEALGEIGKGYLTGQPPAGLPRQQASYQLYLKQGMNPTQAAVAAFGGSILAGEPLNLLGGATYPWAKVGLNKAYDVGVRPWAGKVLSQTLSRTADMPFEQRLSTSRALEEARRPENTINFQKAKLQQRLQDLGRKGSDTGVLVDAVENYKRQGEAALANLKPAESQWVKDWAVTHAQEPDILSSLHSQPWQLHSHITGAAEKAADLIQTAMRAPKRPPEQLSLGEPTRTMAVLSKPSGTLPRAQEFNYPTEIYGGVEHAPSAGGLPPPQTMPQTPLPPRPPTAAEPTGPSAQASAVRAINEYNKLAGVAGVEGREDRPWHPLYANPENLPQALQTLQGLPSRLVGSFPRPVTPELRALLPQEVGGGRKYGTPIDWNELATHPSLRRVVDPTMLRSEADAALRQEYGLKGPAFQSPEKSIMPAAMRTGGQARNASLLMALTQDAVPVEQARAGYVPVKSLGVLSGMDKPTRDRLSGLAIPKEKADYIAGFGKFEDPRSQNAVWEMTQALNRDIKPLMTVTSPAFLSKFMGFHALEFVTRAGRFAPKSAYLATKIMGPLSPEDAAIPVSIKGWPQVRTLGDLQKNEIAAGNLDAGRTMDPSIRLPGTNRLSRAFDPVANLNSSVYSWTRAALDISHGLRGLDPIASSLKTKDALVDYSPPAYTNLENEFRRNAGLFYAFPRKIIPELSRVALQRPGTVGALAQIAPNAAASVGLSMDQYRKLGERPQSQGFVPLSRDTTGGEDKVRGMYETVSPAGHLNEIFGSRGPGRGGMGQVDALMSILSAPLVKAAVISMYPRNTLTGQSTVGEEGKKPEKAPPWGRALAGHFGITADENGVYAPRKTVQWLYTLPNIFNVPFTVAKPGEYKQGGKMQRWFPGAQWDINLKQQDYFDRLRQYQEQTADTLNARRLERLKESAAGR